MFPLGRRVTPRQLYRISFPPPFLPPPLPPHSFPRGVGGEHWLRITWNCTERRKGRGMEYRETWIRVGLTSRSRGRERYETKGNKISACPSAIWPSRVAQSRSNKDQRAWNDTSREKHFTRGNRKDESDFHLPGYRSSLPPKWMFILWRMILIVIPDTIFFSTYTFFTYHEFYDVISRDVFERSILLREWERMRAKV